MAKQRMVRQGCFAAIDASAKKPHIVVWTIRARANQVRQEVGKAFDMSNPAYGWIEARDRYGFRVHKIELVASKPARRKA